MIESSQILSLWSEVVPLSLSFSIFFSLFLCFFSCFFSSISLFFLLFFSCTKFYHFRTKMILENYKCPPSPLKVCILIFIVMLLCYLLFIIFNEFSSFFHLENDDLTRIKCSCDNRCSGS